jgi:predicted nuclease of restriction endonuclease-like (RecB) superfamily
MIEPIENLGFSILQQAIKQARDNAFSSVNAELVNLYWQTGAFVSKQLEQSTWGDKTVQKLSEFLLKNDPALKGFDRKSIYRMVQFYECYKETAFLAPVADQHYDTVNQSDVIVATLWRQAGKETPQEIVATLWRQFSQESIKHSVLTKLNWSVHKILISRTKSDEEREFYIWKCIHEKYSVREIDRQISAGLYERTMLGNSTISKSLKTEYSDIINTFKDSYIFEFLNLPDHYSENDLQKGLITQMKNVILELGKDFLFVSDEYKVMVGDSDFYIDLLFYHRGLQCLVAFELKTDKFIPEYLGKLNFYLEALDRDVKKPNEKPSIGILLCKDKDTEVVEYAMSRSLSPAMVAAYKTMLPEKKILQQKLHELFENTTKINPEK